MDRRELTGNFYKVIRMPDQAQTNTAAHPPTLPAIREATTDTNRSDLPTGKAAKRRANNRAAHLKRPSTAPVSGAPTQGVFTQPAPSHSEPERTGPFTRLKNRLKQATSLIRLRFFSPAEVAVNSSNVPCATQGAVTVQFKQGNETVEHRIHANKFDIDRASNNATQPPQRQTYVAGQSPNDEEAKHFLACEKMLVQGIESGQGVYQFVSEAAHVSPEKSRERPLLGTLLKQWNEGPQPMTLGGRFRVTKVEMEDPPAPGESELHRRCMVTVIDPREPDAPPRVIPVTQVGMALTKKHRSATEKPEKYLNAEQIIHADTILQKHRSLARSEPLVSDTAQVHPLIVSYAGFGRNATLITFSEIKQRIDAGIVTDQQSIDDALVEVITAGRKVRGTEVMRDGVAVPVGNFVHSNAQLATLREALTMHLDTVAAISATQHAVGVSRNTAAGRAFNSKRWDLLENGGIGDCLFFALAGEDLTRDVLKRRRTEVANVLSNRLDTEQGMNRNAHEDALARRQRNPHFEQFKEQIANDEFANYQKTPGNFCGDMEIEQWVEVANNQKMTVVLVDALPGYESIKTFAYNQEVHVQDFADSSNTQTESEIFAAIEDAMYVVPQSPTQNVRTIPNDRIVLYRTKAHFQRLCGTLTPEQVEENAREHAADLKQQAKEAEEADITKLGFETRTGYASD